MDDIQQMRNLLKEKEDLRRANQILRGQRNAAMDGLALAEAAILDLQEQLKSRSLQEASGG